jgi:hypothetical protein
MIEFAPAGEGASPLLLGTATAIDPRDVDPARAGIGSLREDPGAARRDPEAGEPA